MDSQDVERRLQDIERKLELGVQKRQAYKEHRVESRKRRGLYAILGRVFALALAYPFIALFLWFIETPRPWVHALTPAVTVLMFTIVAPLIQNALLTYTHEKREEKREELVGLE